MNYAGEVHTRFWQGDPSEEHHLEDPGKEGKIILKWNFSMWDGGSWTGFVWLRIGAGGGPL